MQHRAFEKYVWGTAAGFCLLMLMSETANASALQAVINTSQNPTLYIFGLIGTYAGCKLMGASSGQF